VTCSSTSWASTRISFVAPGDDGTAAGTAVDVLVVSFLDSAGAVIGAVDVAEQPATAGQRMRVTLTELSPATPYTIVVDVFDDLDNGARSAPLSFVTAGVVSCTVDADCSVLRAGHVCRRSASTDDVTAAVPPNA